MRLENIDGGLSLESPEDEAKRLRQLAEMQQESERVAGLTVDQRAAELTSLDRQYSVSSNVEGSALVLNNNVEQIALPNDILISDSYPSSIIVSDHDEKGKFYIAVSVDPRGVVLGHRFNLISIEAMPDQVTGRQSDERKIVIGNGQQYGQSGKEQAHLLQIAATYGGTDKLKRIIKETQTGGVKSLDQEMEDQKSTLTEDFNKREVEVVADKKEKARIVLEEGRKRVRIEAEISAKHQAEIEEYQRGEIGRKLQAFAKESVSALKQALLSRNILQALRDNFSKNTLDKFGNRKEVLEILADELWNSIPEATRSSTVMDALSRDQNFVVNQHDFTFFAKALAKKIGWNM